jgi:hypothetical protein
VKGENLSCSVRFNNVVIVSNESFKTSFVELKSNALIYHVRIVVLVSQ